MFEMMRKILVSLAVAGILSVGPAGAVVQADTPSTTIQSSFFDQNSADDDNDFQFANSPSSGRPRADRLAIPDNTPTPLEGIKWKKKKLKIYMSTQDPQLQWAYKDAVKKWNKVKAVHMTWTDDEEKANIIAADGDLSNNTTGNSNVGYRTSELGSTRTEYNPDTNALHLATSTLDPNQLDYTNKQFRSEVAQHELGHALGLAHAPEYEHSVMIPRNIKTGITKNDAKTLRMLYRD